MKGKQTFGGDKRPLVSVIVPVYNVEKYIHRCINSILQQTYKNLEVILIDDGSLDKCGMICDEYEKLDERVKVIHQENAGLSVARNTGLMNCNGEFITFVDSDDFISLDYIDVLYSNMDNFDYVSCGFFRTDCEENVKSVFSPVEEIVLTGEDALFEYYSKAKRNVNINCVYVWGKLYRREVWKGLYFPKGLIFEDIYLMPYILLRCEKVKFIPYRGYYYRETPNSITNTSNVEHRKKAFVDSFVIWNNHENLYSEYSLYELVIAVECLKIDKIITQTIAGSIPAGMEMSAKKMLQKSVGKVLKEHIPWMQKVRYVLFLILGKDLYSLLRKLVR